MSNRVAIAAIFGVFFCEAAVIGQWIPRIPDIKDKLALSDSALGLVLLTLPLGTLIGLAFASRIIAASGGLRAACQRYLPLWALLFIPPGLVPGAGLLAVSLFFAGLCIALVETGMNTAAARLETLTGRRLMSRSHGFWSLGTMIGALVGGAFAQAEITVAYHYLWIMPLIAIGGYLAASALPREIDAVAPAPQEIAEITGDAAPVIGQEPAEPVPPPPAALFSLPHRGMLLLCIMPLGIMMVEGAFIDWSAVFMRDILAADPWLTSLTYSFFAIVMSITRLMGDSIATRFGDVLVARVSGLMATVGIVLFALAPDSTVAFIGAALSGAGVAIVFPLAVSAAARRPERTATENVASLNIIAFSAFLIAPPIIGFLSDSIGLRQALLCIAPLAFLTFLLAKQVGK